MVKLVLPVLAVLLVLAICNGNVLEFKSSPTQQENPEQPQQQHLTVKVEPGDDGKSESVAVAQSKDASLKLGVNGYCPDGTPCSGSCCLVSSYPLRYGCCPYPHVS